MVLLVFLLLAACPFLFCLSFSSLFACLLIFSALFGVIWWNSSNRHFLSLRWNSPRLRTTLLSESISTGLQRFGVTNLNINLPKLPSILILNRGFRVWMLLYQNLLKADPMLWRTSLLSRLHPSSCQFCRRWCCQSSLHLHDGQWRWDIPKEPASSLHQWKTIAPNLLKRTTRICQRGCLQGGAKPSSQVPILWIQMSCS